jgi:uncharacterized protein YfiM (DUF2279 family)
VTPVALAAAAMLALHSGAAVALPQGGNTSGIAGSRFVTGTAHHSVSAAPAELPTRTLTQPWYAPDATTQHAMRDPWVGEDKAQHLAMSYAITTFGYSGVRSAGAGRDASLALAAGSAIAAGLTKEVLDRRRGGIFSYRDLVADLVGIGAGVLLLGAAR